MKYPIPSLMLVATLGAAPVMAKAATPQAPPVSAIPGGALVGGYQRLTIPEAGFTLDRATRISVDEIVINGTVVTNGNPLSIDTRRIVFGPNGKIVAFVAPAATGLEGQRGGNGESGASASGRGARGGTGETGRPGFPGTPGVPGRADPGPILVFGAASEGTMQIDASGQAGGDGGKGGKGGRGGPGGKGGKGEVNCLSSDTPGGTGGTGGNGGRGGVGGNGGIGGNGAAVRLLLGANAPVVPAIKTAGGSGGMPGEPGDGGNGGSGGPGGDGDAVKCGLVIPDTVDGGGSGSPGSIGPAGPRKAVPGEAGKSGDLLERVYSDLEALRFRVHREFYGFHESRMLYLLFQKSLALTLADETLRKKLSVLLEKIASGQGGVATNRQLADLVIRMRKMPAQEVALAWEHQFIRPAEAGLAAYAESREPAVNARIRAAIAYAREVIGLLKRIEEAADSAAASAQSAAKRIAELASYGRAFMEEDLNRAFIACEEFNEKKASSAADYAAEILGATAHYLIPACEGNPDFSIPSNAFAEIELSAAAQPVLPDALQGFIEVISPSKDQKVSRIQSSWDRIVAFATAFLLPAYAAEEDPSVIIVGTQPLPVETLDAARPAAVPLARGILTGYQVPDGDLEGGALEVNLRVLSYWIGGGK